MSLIAGLTTLVLASGVGVVALIWAAPSAPQAATDVGRVRADGVDIAAASGDPSGSTSASASPSSSPAAGPLPFDLPAQSTLRSSAHKVFAHYFTPYPISLDNQDGASDYYARNYLTAGGESGKHAAYGGLLRDRPQPRAAAVRRLAVGGHGERGTPRRRRRH